MSACETGKLQGFSAPRPRFDIAGLSVANCNYSRVGKKHFAATKSFLRRKQMYGFPAIGRKSLGAIRLGRAAKYIALKQPCKAPGVTIHECARVSRLPSIEGITDAAHFSRHGEVTDPHFTHARVHVAAELIE